MTTPINKSLFIGLICWISTATHQVLAQLPLMSPVFDAAIPIVEEYETNKNIVLKCESDFLFGTIDSFRKSFRFPFMDGEVYHFDLFGKANNLDTYTITMYYLDEKGNRDGIVPDPINGKGRVTTNFRVKKEAYFDIEISGTPKKKTDYYLQYAFLVTREKGDDLDEDEKILDLVKHGKEAAETFETQKAEPVHIEINTLMQGQDVEVLRRFNTGRDYIVAAISKNEVPELKLDLYEKQKDKWKHIVSGTQYERKDPESGDYVYATVSPSIMTEYAAVIGGKRYKKGEMSGRCLIFIAAQKK